MSISTSTLRRAQRSFSRQLTNEATATRFKTSVTEGVYQTLRFRPPDACSKCAPQSRQRVESNFRNLTSEFRHSSGVGGRTSGADYGREFRSTPHPNEKLVRVFDTEQESEA